MTDKPYIVRGYRGPLPPHTEPEDKSKPTVLREDGEPEMFRAMIAAGGQAMSHWSHHDDCAEQCVENVYRAMIKAKRK
jgi:hypothetical protein